MPRPQRLDHTSRRAHHTDDLRDRSPFLVSDGGKEIADISADLADGDPPSGW